MFHPEGVSTAKMVNFCPAIIELWMCKNGIFLVPVKYTLVYRVPALAAQHTIVCLDHKELLLGEHYQCPPYFQVIWISSVK